MRGFNLLLWWAEGSLLWLWFLGGIASAGLSAGVEIGFLVWRLVVLVVTIGCLPLERRLEWLCVRLGRLVWRRRVVRRGIDLFFDGRLDGIGAR